MSVQLEFIESKCISNQAPHSAFTDLIFYQNEWYCAFREGSSHMSLDGQAKVLKSKNGLAWDEFAVLTWQGGDVRDPKFVIRHDGKLLITVGVRLAVPTVLSEKIFSTSWLFDSDNGLSGPFYCNTSSGTWRWGPTQYGSDIFSVGYAGKDLEGCLYKSADGKNWQAYVRPFFPESPCFTNESSLVFTQSETAFCLLRRDGANCSGLWGVAKKPYTRWNWFNLPLAIGGPKLIELSTGQLIACFRLIEVDSEGALEAKTVLYEISPVGEMTFLIQLPSDGDTSYAGMVECDKDLWVSYYSSHEEKSSIYIAKLHINLTN
ncbi:hypothetical protein [Thiomicrorhabdus lithotrophica]|uniref:Exo-alpha-sialidase n=1 Tax=Thiomicrorhabdus lithotrophica TaxID=2949997 RepID=A0ABY8CEZ5_9GAMM|nr:hypothetical protein [Thiomicrorhabdus lithotrophica]WEJ63367.1 hypothetical protein NR989_03680 [Thiomicrorhabdus lithotrophica]